MAGSRVDLYAALRSDARTGMSNRALQRKHGVGYRTVAAALESAWPKARKPQPKRGSRLESYRDVIDGWVRDDHDTPRKQPHSAKIGKKSWREWVVKYVQTPVVAGFI